MSRISTQFCVPVLLLIRIEDGSDVDQINSIRAKGNVPLHMLRATLARLARLAIFYGDDSGLFDAAARDLVWKAA